MRVVLQVDVGRAGSAADVSATAGVLPSPSCCTAAESSRSPAPAPAPVAGKSSLLLHCIELYAYADMVQTIHLPSHIHDNPVSFLSLNGSYVECVQQAAVLRAARR